MKQGTKTVVWSIAGVIALALIITFLTLGG
jgi:hypothetical protein